MRLSSCPESFLIWPKADEISADAPADKQSTYSVGPPHVIEPSRYQRAGREADAGVDAHFCQDVNVVVRDIRTRTQEHSLPFRFV